MSEHQRALYVAEPVSFGDDQPRSCADVLLRAADRHSGAGVVSVLGPEETTTVTYPELLDRARRLLTVLRERGAAAGDHVVIYGSGDPLEYFVGFWACVLGGMRPLLMAHPQGSVEPGEARRLLDRVCALLDDPLIVCGSPVPADLGADLRLVDTAASGSEVPALSSPATDSSGTVMLMMSSGSTGSPKLIQLTEQGLLEFAAGTPTMLALRPGETTLNWLPLDHSGAFLLYHLLAVFAGCTQVHLPTHAVTGDPLLWLDLIEKHRVTHTWAPNFGYRMVTRALAHRPDRHWDLSSVRTLVSGGEQITVPVMEEFFRATAAYGIRPETFFPAWGMTETVTAMTFARPGLAANLHRVRTASLTGELQTADDNTDPAEVTEFVAVGAPAPGTAVRVVDENDEVLPVDRIGRLQVSSARVTPGYLGDSEATAAAFAVDAQTGRSWLRTGDLAFCHDGQIFMAGREGDRIIINGANYYALAVEALVETVSGVVPGLVGACGVPDAATGSEALTVFFGTDDVAGSAPVARAVQDRVFRQLRLTARAVAVPRDAFPRTASGKIQRSLLHRRYLDGAYGPAADARTRPKTRPAAGDRRDAARRILYAVLGEGTDEAAPFYEAGADSITLVRLHAELERELNTAFPRSAMFEHSSMTELLAYLDTVAAETMPAQQSEPAPPAPPVRDHRVAIIGIAARLPGADTLDEFWTNLVAGATSMRRFSAEELAEGGLAAAEYTHPDFVPVTGALTEIDGFDAEFFGLSPQEARTTDPAHRLFLECCHHALEDAGYAGPQGRGRVGVFAGTGMNLYTHQSYLVRNLLAGQDGDPLTAMQAAIGTEPDFFATRVAYRLGLTGPAIGVQTACSTSLVAVHLACQALLTGDADLAIAGAAALHVPQENGYRHFPGSILSPTGQCRAFDASADGTVGGNGVAAVILKRLDRALADGDTVHAVILGSAVNNDGDGKVGYTAPSSAGQSQVIEQALDRAGVPAETITYLEAHGTGTPVGDPIELRAAARALQRRTDQVGFCTVGSVKPNIGHLDTCAGMAGLIKTVLMLRHRTLVPLANFAEPNPELDLEGGPLVLGTRLREWTTAGFPRRAGVTALGVGGTNAHVVLEEAPPAQRPTDAGDGKDLGILTLSAAHPAALTELTGRMVAHLTAVPGTSVADLTTTMALGRRHHRHRIAVVGDTTAELVQALGRAVPTEVPAGGPGPLVFAFGGQGSSGIDAAGVLYDSFDEVKAVFDECEQVYAQETGDSLLTLIREGELSTTATAQPALFAYQVALARLWRSFGIEPSHVVGHSLGEYAALCTAGALTLEDGLRLVTARGRLMEHNAATGEMLAVFATDVTLSELMAATPVELAAANGPAEYVVAGPAEAVEHALDWLAERHVISRRLTVGRAFHTSLLDPMLDAFADRAAATPMAPTRIPVASSLTGELLPPGSIIDAAYLRRQTRETVRFSDALNALARAGCRRFLDLGPDAVLTALGRRTLPSSRWTAGQQRPTEPVRAVRLALAELYHDGWPLKPAALAMGGRRIALPHYPFQHRPHWTPPSPAPSPVAASAVSVARPDDRSGEVLAAVRTLVAPQLGVQPAEIRPEVTFLEQGADSLVMLRVVQQVRQRFGIEIAVGRLFSDADTPQRLTALIVAAGSMIPEARPAPEISQVLPAPDPVAEAPVHTMPAREPSAEDHAVLSLATEQLRVTGQLIQQVTSLMREQLSALQASNPATTTSAVLPSREQQPTTEKPASKAPAPARLEPTGGGLDFSLYFFGDYPDQNNDDKYGAIVEAAKFADQHGFHGLWFPERHFHSFGGLFPNPVVLAAALARETARIRLNAGSVVLPLHHPLRVAEEWSVVDNLSGGRVGLCVASGWHANDFALNPDAYGDHRSLMYEHLDTVRALWSGATVPMRSGSGEDVELRIFPRPVQDMPPLYVAVVSNPDSYRSAAAADLGVVTNLMSQSLDQLADNIALYRRTRAEHGLDPRTGRVVVLVHAYLADDLHQARDEAYRPFCDYLRSSLSLFGQVTNSLGMNIDEDSSPEDVEFLLSKAYERYCEERALIGTPESVQPVLDRLAALGADEIACFVDFGVTAQQLMTSLPIIDALRRRQQRPTARAPQEPAASAPLAAAQRGMWFLDRTYPVGTSYHEPKAVLFDGPLDVVALQQALSQVVQRHPVLRTVFRQEQDGVRQVVLETAGPQCPLVDLPGGSPEEALRAALRDFGALGIDLATGPLLHWRIVRLAEDRHLLVAYVHHIIFDSSSTAVLLRDAAAFYRGGADRLPVLPMSFHDHVRATALSPEDRMRARDHWQRTLAEAPPLHLPTDRPRPPVMTARGAALVQEWDEQLATDVRQFSRQQQVTPFMTLSAAIALVLGRFGGQDDLVIGTALTNRPPGTEDLIGLFIDSVPLRIDLSSDSDLGGLARRVREVSTTAFEHAGVGFDEMVTAVNPSRDPSRNPLFQVMVEFENATEIDFDPGRLRTTVIEVPSDRAPLDLTFYLTQHKSGMTCSVEYNTDLFDEATVQRLLLYVEVVLRRASADPLAGLAALTAPVEADRALMDRWSGSRFDGTDKCLHELVGDQADRNPEAIALIDGDVRVTYGELDRRANALAWRLLDQGGNDGKLVAVCLPRGVELIVTLLGVLKAGAAYLPLDRNQPLARSTFLVRDSGATALVTDDAKLAEHLGLPSVAATGDDVRADHAPGVESAPDRTAYVIYTSGSTGQPKGVAVPHRGAANLVAWYQRERPALRTLQWVSVSFDVSVQEIFTTLSSGAALVLIADDARYDPAVIASVVEEHQVERLFMTFTASRYLLENATGMYSLREIVAAGEEMVLTPEIREFLAARPHCVLYNEYGPTEASIIATIQRVDPAAGDRPPIGHPIGNVTVQILDEQLRPLPPGAVGELFLGGVGLAQGYLGRPQETASAFVDDPASPGTGLYRTRDRGRWLPDGSVQYLGRTDDQVKIRGHRVEPGETQRALTELPEVRYAAVVARTDPKGETRLVGYVVPAGTDIDAQGTVLARRLAATLPSYLIPTAWATLPELPVTTSGKLDRTALPEPGWSDGPRSEPTTALECTLHDLWCAQLEVPEVSADASFFALGGHSLSAVGLVDRIRSELGTELKVIDLFRAPSVRAMAGLLTDRMVTDTASVSGFQWRGWHLHRSSSRPAVYNVPYRVTIEGDLDVGTLRAALARLVERHAALRTRFGLVGRDVVQQVLSHVAVELPVDDLTDRPSQLDDWYAEQTGAVIDPEQAPLWRMRLARLGTRHWILAVSMHHLITDGWSMSVLWDELSILYASPPGTTEQLEPAMSYPDYVRERAARVEANRDELTRYWQQTLAGVPLRLELPYDRPRPETLSGAGALHRIELPTATIAQLRQAAKATDTTETAVLTAGFAVWLGRLCKRDDLVIALSNAGRTRSEYRRLVGPVGEALLVRATLRDDLTFGDLVRQISERTFEALDHHELSLWEVGKALGTDLTTPQLLFTVVTNPSGRLELPGLTATVENTAVTGVARTELYIVCVPTTDGITVAFEYSTDLFEPETVTAWAAALATTLQELTQDPNHHGIAP